MSSTPFLSKSDSIALKGFAILLVLFHHIFLGRTEYIIDFLGVNILQKAAFAAKVSVSIFVLLSAYGLSESSKNKKNDLGQFYFTRLFNLYFTYWIIFIFFVTLGTFVFHYSPSMAYGDNFQYKMLIEFLGLHMFSFGLGYNMTWWFVSLILTLYFLFPFLYTLTKTYKWIMLIIGYNFMMSGLGNYSGWLNVYVMSFILGIFLSVAISDEFKQRASDFLLRNFTANVLVFVGIGVVGYQRFQYSIHSDVFVDYIFALLIILFVWVLIKKISPLHYFFSLYGKVSYEIFLIHSFIYWYFLPQTVYGFKNPFLMFISLAISSYIISWMFHKIITFIYEKWVKSVLPQNINTRIKF